MEYKYSKYKSKYLHLKGGHNTQKQYNILLLFYTYVNTNADEKNKEIEYYTNILKHIGKVYTYDFKFNNTNNKFTLDDYYFKNASDDIIQFIKTNKIENPIVVCLGHASPYGLYAVDKYPELFSGIVCYPLRLYIKASLERRIWKFRDQGGWAKHMPAKYDFETYYMNPTNKEIQILLEKPGEKELEVLYHVGDKLLQVQADDIPKKFKIPTILFTRFDMDVDSIIKLNYERKAIAEMKGIVSEKDALYTSMMWNFDRVKYDKNLMDLNKDNDNLRIKYYIAGLENDKNLSDAVINLLH